MNTHSNSNSKFILEIAVNSYSSALAAQEGGADRIELFSGYYDGGLTPSYSLVKKISEDIQIPIVVMIRPREGDFNYSLAEIEIMKNDILLFKKLNIFGFVFGILNEDFKVDKIKNKILIDAAHPYPCTFHRAFDFCMDPFQGVNDCIELGFKRILSSGQEKNCEIGSSLLKKLIEKTEDKIEIMPGAGIHSENFKKIITDTGASEFHASAKEIIYPNKNIDLKKELEEILIYTKSNTEEIIKLKNILNTYHEIH